MIKMPVMTQNLLKPVPETDAFATPEDIVARLEELKIAFEHYHHDPVFTVEEGLHLHDIIPGGHCKNLFLKDKKGQRWLISAIESTVIDLKSLPEKIGCARVSFGSPDRLWESLKVKPGSVTPFALINDTTQHVNVVLDKALFEYEQVNFHPLINDQSIALAPDDLKTYIKACGHEFQSVDFT